MLIVFRLVTAVIFSLGSLNAAEGPSKADSRPSSATQRGLSFSVGQRGLDSLSFNGQSLLSSSESGNLQLAKSLFHAALDAVLPKESSPETTLNPETQTVDVKYLWGHISCAYRKTGETLGMRVQIANTSAEALDVLSLRLMELNFPNVPNGNTLEAGMFGFGFKGTTSPLYLYPLVADPRFVAPIVRVDFQNGALNFCSDDLECAVEVPYTTNPLARTNYPFVVTSRDLKPGTTRSCDVSLRFGSAGSSVPQLSGDVVKRYAAKYPFQVRWKDHRPVGAIFLASSGIKVATNPRRWIMNDGNFDVATDEGRKRFRDALLKLADSSISILRDTNAQGMITWDPEGQEFSSACYYGDPRLTPTLAPEMEFKGDGAIPTIDEYFRKFRAAGLKVGVCIRPQRITVESGKPKQGVADDEQAAQVLKDKIGYAKQRWGCTLFYVDSTTTMRGPLDPNVFKSVADAFPDVLLIPENESMRYFAYSAPFNSYLHHKITSTPAGARIVYPTAFSVLMVPDADLAEDHTALVGAARNGDILLFNCWYKNPGATAIKAIYQEAKPKDAHSNSY